MNVVFDVGRVLLHWEPEPVLADLLGTEDRIAAFRAEVDFLAWHQEQDRGRTPAEAVAVARELYPAYADLLGTLYDRWLETIPGPIWGTVEVLQRLHEAEIPLFAITNFPAEQWVKTVPAYPFLGVFRDVVVSGEEKLLKPDPAIYRVLLERNGLDPAGCIFIDDSPKNVDGATAIGMQAIHFTDPPALVTALRERGLPA
ncbi:MAG: HAD family phosphatase [Pseudomonadota bacterium]